MSPHVSTRKSSRSRHRLPGTVLPMAHTKHAQATGNCPEMTHFSSQSPLFAPFQDSTMPPILFLICTSRDDACTHFAIMHARKMYACKHHATEVPVIALSVSILLTNSPSFQSMCLSYFRYGWSRCSLILPNTCKRYHIHSYSRFSLERGHLGY